MSSDGFSVYPPAHNPWDEDFRFHRALWRVLMDATAPLGILRYAVRRSDPADCAWLELCIWDSRAAEVIIPDFITRALEGADWASILRRIRHCQVARPRDP